MKLIDRWERGLSTSWRTPVPFRDIIKQAVVQLYRTIRKG